MRRPATPYDFIPVLVSALLLFTGCGEISVNGQGEAKTLEHDIPSLDRRLVLTFDDLPYQGPSATFSRDDRFDIPSLRSMNQDLVSALQQANAPAIGFVNEGKLKGKGGTQSAERDALLEIWLEAGLELGNHSYSHQSIHQIPLDEYQADILRGEVTTKRLAKKWGQQAPRFFRHPFLHTGRTPEIKNGLVDFLHHHGYRVAPVTTDNAEWIFAKAYALALTQDKETQTADENAGTGPLAPRVKTEYLDYMMARAVYSERQSRELLDREVPQILLLHDNRLNADAITELIARYQARGYRLIDLATALEDPAFERPDGYLGPAGISWIERWAFAENREDVQDKSFFRDHPETAQWILDLAEIDNE